MFRGPQVSPLSEAPRVMPEGTLPAHTGEPPMTNEQAAVTLHNPLTASRGTLEAGKLLYLNQCAVCHGAAGEGDGPVVHLLRKHPDSLASETGRNWTDGYIYGVIRNGHGYMPSLGDAMSSDERWSVILYVRSLQQPGLASPQAADAAAPVRQSTGETRGKVAGR